MGNAVDATFPVAVQIPDFGPKPRLLNRYLEQTKAYSALRLIVELTAVGFALKLLVGFALGLSPWADSLEKFVQGQPALDLGFVIDAILVAPILETVLLQWIPIKITSCFTSRPGVLVVVSAIIFAAAHINPCHALAVFPAGLVLGWVFVSKRNESLGQAFWLTAVVHLLHNVVAIAWRCVA
jgi:membrane protease YdiL (CAAX protease family)